VFAQVSTWCKGGAIGIAGDGHRIAVQADLGSGCPELCGNADIPGRFGTDIGGLCGTAVPECGLEIRTAEEGEDRGRILSSAVCRDLNLAVHLGSVQVEVADIRLVGLLHELDFGKAEGVCFARNFCDDRIIRGCVRKLCSENPLCGLRDCSLNEICCHVFSFPRSVGTPSKLHTIIRLITR